MWRPVPESTEQGEVYLLHFHEPIGTEQQQARHYCGWARDAERRIEQHRCGQGSRLTRVLYELGIGFDVAAIFPGTRADERRLKNNGGLRRVCPICRTTGQGRRRNAEVRDLVRV